MKPWQQYGIAVSVAWMIVVTAYLRYQELPKAQAYATQAYFVCTEHKIAAGEKDINPCLENVGSDWDEWMNRKWGKIAAVALLPVAGAWLVALAGLFFYQRRQSDQVKQDN